MVWCGRRKYFNPYFYQEASFRTLFLPSTPTTSSNFFPKILPKEKEEKRLNPILLTKRNIDKYCHHGYWPLIHVRIRNWNDAWTITPTVSEYASFREEKVSVVLGFFHTVLRSLKYIEGHWRFFLILTNPLSETWRLSNPFYVKKDSRNLLGRSLNGQF